MRIVESSPQFAYVDCIVVPLCSFVRSFVLLLLPKWVLICTVRVVDLS